jgi:hypothetical protein
VRNSPFLQGIIEIGGSRRAAEVNQFARIGNRDIGMAPCQKRAKSEIESPVRRDVSREGGSSAPGEPVEIRVSDDAIIEMHGSGSLRHVASFQIGDESYRRTGDVRNSDRASGAFRDELRLVWSGDRAGRRRFARSRRAWRAIVAYSLFCAAIVCVIWFLLK